nr:FtsX-like permease family protein [Arthrobacter roseus]
MTTLVNAPGRNRLIALLRTLGFPPSRDRGLLLWELIPPAVVALVVGAGVGLLLPTIVMQAVDLRIFTGGPLPVGLAPDPVLLGLFLGGFVLVVLGSVAAAVAVGRRQRIAAVLRIGEE